MHLYPIDGAVHRVARNDTAWNTRNATWSMVIAGIDADPGKAEALKSWGRRYWQAVHPFNLAGAYAEKSPVVVISGAPGMEERRTDPLLHHRHVGKQKAHEL